MPKILKNTPQFIRYKNAKWIGIICLACVWMFVLGIFVGRGTAPVRFDIEKLQKELIALKKANTKEEKEKSELYMEEAQKKTNLGFYEALKTDDKENGLQISALEKTTAPEEKDPETTVAVSLDKDVLNPNSSPVVSSGNGESKLSIQIASVRDLNAADEMVKELQKHGYQGAYRSIGNVPGKGVWYRVRVGYFIDRTEAEEAMSRLKQDKYNPLLIQGQ